MLQRYLFGTFILILKGEQLYECRKVRRTIVHQIR